MNERIRQLAEQANFANKDEESIEYFAELIIRECCQVLEHTQTALDRHKWPTPSECGIYIKEHFGVEK